MANCDSDGNCERLSSVTPSENEAIKNFTESIPKPIAGELSISQDDSAEEDNVYVEVTILAKIVRANQPRPGKISEPILLKQLLVWDYFKIPNDRQNITRQQFMQHITSDGLVVELGICQAGPFGIVGFSAPRNCRMINFTGPDDNFTMSNTDDSLFLRARLQQRDVVVRAQPPNSHFLLQSIGVSPSGATKSVIRLVTNQSLAFKYDEDTQEVVIDTFQQSDASFQFDLIPPELVNVQFVQCNNDKHKTG